MKGEYLETKSESQNMFSKLQQQQQQQVQLHHNSPSPLQTHSFTLPFQVTPTRECQTSEDDNTSRSSGPQNITAQKQPKLEQQQHHHHSGDGASIEVVRRPRGRPPGSKNRPKPPVIITRDTESAMSPYILEVPGGNDVIEAIARFCRRKNIGLCVLTGSGTVGNVTLRQPSTTPGAMVTFHGRFDILSICATFIPHTTSYPVPSGFTISIAGPQGRIVGGLVSGALIAVGTVFVIAASFNNPLYHRLPAVDEIINSVSGSGGGGGAGEAQSPPESGGGESGGHGASHESGGMPMYSCHMSSDVIWAPTARHQPPPPPPPPY